MAVNMLQTEVNLIKEGSNSSCTTNEFNKICIREYVANIRGSDPDKCWPFRSVCDFKDLDTQNVALASQIRESTAVEVSRERDVESEALSEIIKSKELNDGMDKIISDGTTELVNISKSPHEKSVNGGAKKSEISVIANDANSGTKYRILSDIVRDLAGPNLESNVHLSAGNSNKVNGKADKANKSFTIDDEDDSDGDTLGSFLRKRKGIKVATLGNSGAWNKKKACVAKPPKGSKAKTKSRKSPAEPHDNFSTGKLAQAINAIEDEMALAAKRRKSGLYDKRGGTVVPIVCQPVAGVGGSKDTGMVAATPYDHWTLVCLFNRNPADFSIPSHENKYMRRYRV